MKHLLGHPLSYGVIGLIGALAFTGCSKGLHSGGSEKEAPVKTISISPKIATNVNNFSFDFLHQMQKAAAENENFFVSPLSLHMDLGMVLNGANGTTYEEMFQMLGLDGSSIGEVNAAYHTLLEELPEADPKVQLGLYNSIWYRNTWNFKQDFLSEMKKSFDATVTPLDFKPEDNKYINEWASDKTNGRITKVLDPIQPENVMFLVNALYFKGKWSSQFKKDATKAAEFHLEDGNNKQVQMMYQKNSFERYMGSDYSAVRLPYGNGQFAMTIILPAEGQKLDEVLKGLDANGWEALKGKMVKGGVRIGLPRFTIPAYEIKLNSVLENMGMKAAFDDNAADLSKMADIGGSQLYVSFVKQNTFLKVDEEGTEAAAVTTTGISTTSVTIPPSIICDHPFGIIISEKTSNTILFMGKIMNPDSE